MAERLHPLSPVLSQKQGWRVGAWSRVDLGHPVHSATSERETVGWPSSLCVLSRRGGEGNGNPLQCSCLEKLGDRGAWWAAVYGVAQSQTRLK